MAGAASPAAAASAPDAAAGRFPARGFATGSPDGERLARIIDDEDDGKLGRFIDKHGHHWLNAPMECGSTPLSRVCQSFDGWRMVRSLLQIGADPNVRDTDGMTPLAHCIMGNNCRRLRCLGMLLSSGASLLAVIGEKPLLMIAKEQAEEAYRQGGAEDLDVAVWEAIQSSVRKPLGLLYDLPMHVVMAPLDGSGGDGEHSEDEDYSEDEDDDESAPAVAAVRAPAQGKRRKGP